MDWVASRVLASSSSASRKSTLLYSWLKRCAVFWAAGEIRLDFPEGPVRRERPKIMRQIGTVKNKHIKIRKNHIGIKGPKLTPGRIHPRR